MKLVYFVTEGVTDQIVIQGLVEHWLGDEDFVPNRIQPPSSAYAEGQDSNFFRGLEGTYRAWCRGSRTAGAAGRDEALRQADCLFIHVDADVANNPEFRSPAQDMEAWVVSALHPEVADQHAPIECRVEPGALLVQRAPHRLVRRKGWPVEEGHKEISGCPARHRFRVGQLHFRGGAALCRSGKVRAGKQEVAKAITHPILLSLTEEAQRSAGCFSRRSCLAVYTYAPFFLPPW